MDELSGSDDGLDLMSSFDLAAFHLADHATTVRKAPKESTAYEAAPQPRYEAATSHKHIDALARYEKLKCLGEGTYGVVHKAKDMQTGAFVALKFIKLDMFLAGGVPPSALREISLLRELDDHPHIVELLDVVNADELVLVFEFVAKDLRQFIDGVPGPLPAAQVCTLMYELMRGLSHCHTRAILHRDLKPQNILVTEFGRIKIADFGISRSFSLPVGKLTHDITTRWYRAPEVLLGEQFYGIAVDVWYAKCRPQPRCCALPACAPLLPPPPPPPPPSSERCQRAHSPAPQLRACSGGRAPSSRSSRPRSRPFRATVRSTAS